jgi:DNA mismatch endonuclease (patch repair protein)
VNLAGVPGRPDVAFTRHKLAVFVHGCFWHRCPHCHPPTPRRHRAFWEAKFKANIQRDKRTREQLERQGWETVEFWECIVADSPASCALEVQRLLAKAQDES